jgi:hypothetical protein
VNATILSVFCHAILAALLLSPMTARAETALVLPASGGGVSSAIIGSARALFVVRLAQEAPRLRVIDMDRPPISTPALAGLAVVLGHQAGADVVISLDLRRSDPTTTLSVTAWGLPDGELLFKDADSTTSGPEVIPAMVQAAVVKLLGAAQRTSQRQQSLAPRTLFLGVRGGVRAPRETAGPTPVALGGAGLFLVLQQTRLSAEIGFDHVESAHATSTRLGLALALPFEPEAASGLSLGAGLHWQWSRFGGQGAGGFVVTPSLAWTWHRKESLGLRFEGGVFYDLYAERALDRLIPGAAEPHRSYGLELWVATWL